MQSYCTTAAFCVAFLSLALGRLLARLPSCVFLFLCLSSYPLPISSPSARKYYYRSPPVISGARSALLVSLKRHLLRIDDSM